jgi:methionyl-tRNA synthetase
MEINSFPRNVNWFFTTGTPIPEISMWLFVVIVAWSLAWKGVALWKAARNNQLYWFSALMVVNTIGILEIIYIYVFAKKRPETSSSPVIK